MTTTTIWVLSEVVYAGQCTGFSSETTHLGFFTEAPKSILELAQFLSGRHLPSDMGQAIAAIGQLINNGYYNVNVETNLEIISYPLNTPLNKE